MIIKDIYINGKWWGAFVPSDTQEYIDAMLRMLPAYYDTKDIKIVEKEV